VAGSAGLDVRPVGSYCLRSGSGSLSAMAGIKVLRVQSKMTEGDREPLWYAVVDYGDGVEIRIPLRAHYLITDDALEQQRQSIDAMENLARAMLDFANRTRKRWPNDQG
jgi:hypothetical protein